MSLNNPEYYINLLKGKFPTQYQELITRKTHLVHTAFALINLDVTENQVPWNKCLDCGQPYVIGVGEGNANFCSERCEELTRTYLGY